MPVKDEDAWLEVPFEVKAREPLRLLLNATTSYDFGRYQAYLSGVKIGEPLDLYSKEIENREVTCSTSGRIRGNTRSSSCA